MTATPVPPHYDLATPLIAVSHQPAQVLDHLASLDLDPSAGLLHTGLRLDQCGDPATHASPSQYLRLLANAARALDSPDTSFLLGQTALPGHFGAASHALLQAPTLRAALATLAAHPARLSPLLAPHLAVEPRHAALYWTDACGAPAQRAFLVEMQMSAVKRLGDWLAVQPLPWRYCFNRTAPRRLDAHRAHLGTRLHFGCQIDAMLIEPEWLDRPFPAAPHRTASAAIRDGLHRQALEDESRRGLLAVLHEHLLARVRRPPSLEQTAQDFAMSPATLKRRLHANGTHFQAELDLVRAHVALQLIHGRGERNEAVATYLGFGDATNFRRSFRRWTGTTPTLLRGSLEADAAG